MAKLSELTQGRGGLSYFVRQPENMKQSAAHTRNYIPSGVIRLGDLDFSNKRTTIVPVHSDSLGETR